MNNIWRFLLLLMFAPLMLLVAVEALMPIIAILLSIVIVVSMVLGLLACIAAGAIALFGPRLRLPPRNDGTPLPPGIPPVRRPHRARGRYDDG